MLVDSPPAEAKVAGIILAAGASRRMGSVNKLLASIAGKPLVRHAVEPFVATSLSPIIVVVGYESDKVAAALEGLPVQLVFNPDHANGQGSSVGVGVEALDNNVTDAMIGLGDMPLLPSTLLDSLIHTHIGREGHACNITIPAFEGQRGNPVLWGKTFFPELITLAGDRGGRQLLNDHKAAQHLIACDHSSVLRDVDTVDALAAIVSEAEADLR
jgi:molybdenum cofactor cytidylyltransferase